MSATIVIRLIATVLVFSYLLSLRKGHSISTKGWDEMLAQLNPVELRRLRIVAQDELFAEQETRASFVALYKTIGGGEGIRRMRANADVLISLAAYTELWRPGVSNSVVRKMRADGFRLRRAALIISLSNLIDYPHRLALRAVRDLSKAYCDMVDQLLGLYIDVHISRHPGLRVACSG